MCASCYVVAQRDGFTPLTRGYVSDLVDDIESVRVTWERLEQSYGVGRKNLKASLYKANRPDLIKSVNGNTYGTVNRSEIAAVCRANQPEGHRGFM